MSPKLFSRTKMFNNHQEQHRCFSKICQADMGFDIYLPPQVSEGYPAPVLYFSSGLNSDSPELIHQIGVRRLVTQWNIIAVLPDISPHDSHAGDGTDEFIGQGAGFYVDTAEQSWTMHYQMYSHVSRELPDRVEWHFPAIQECSTAGFSMGGHGAFSIALENSSRYAAIPAFAPLYHPTVSRGGKQAFAAYLDKESNTWQAYDSTSLVQTASRKPPIPVGQDSADPLFPDELQPETFVNAARANGFNMQYKVRPGYEHNYSFIASLIDSHIELHAETLGL